MKILQINKFYYLRGGAERYFFDLMKLLESSGHKAVPFSMNDSRNEMTPYQKYFIDKVELDKFSVRNIIKFFYNYDAVRRLKKAIKEEKPDIAHLHNIAHQMSPAIIRVLKRNNIPVIQTLHDYKIVCPNYRLFSKNEVCFKCKGGKFYNCAMRKCMNGSRLKSILAAIEAYLNKDIYKQVDLFIAPSEFMKKICVEGGIPENKIRVMRNFVSPSFMTAGIENKPEDYFFYYGRLSGEKGIDILLEATKKENFNLKIAGVGPDHERLKSEIKNWKLEDRVELIGPKYGEELKKLIGGARAVIVPSIWPENMPLNILESMFLGRPVIASMIGGIPEIIKDGKTGFLFEPGNVDSLLSKIREISADDFSRMGLDARNDIAGLKGDEYCRGLCLLYKKVIKESRKAMARA